MHMHKQLYIHTYIQTYIHTDIHTYIRTYMQVATGKDIGPQTETRDEAATTDLGYFFLISALEADLWFSTRFEVRRVPNNFEIALPAPDRMKTTTQPQESWILFSPTAPWGRK